MEEISDREAMLRRALKLALSISASYREDDPISADDLDEAKAIAGYIIEEGISFIAAELP